MGEEGRETNKTASFIYLSLAYKLHTLMSCIVNMKCKGLHRTKKQKLKPKKKTNKNRSLRNVTFKPSLLRSTDTLKRKAEKTGYIISSHM